MIHSRAILSPRALEPEAAWQPSPGNYWWRPSHAVFPATNQLLPGDLILYWPLEPNPVQQEIIRYQALRTSPAHAHYTHAAIFVGCDCVLAEARFPRGVVLASLEDIVTEDACILVRRIPSIGTAQREAIARVAAGLRGGSYGWQVILDAKLADYRRRLDYTFALPDAERGLICSQLCQLAVARGARVSLQPVSGELITPAVLSASPELEDVPLSWAKVIPEDISSKKRAP